MFDNPSGILKEEDMPGKVVAGINLDLSLAGEMLSKSGFQLVRSPLGKEEDIVQHAADADAVIVGAIEPYSKKVIQALDKCKIISRMGIGYNNIDVEEAARQGNPGHSANRSRPARIIPFSRWNRF
jgi:phosphoglycerate dehydrogenase-like enzyme